MNRIFLLRLFLDGSAAVLLLFAFAYHWQGNPAHEVAGGGLFLLLVLHAFFQRRWFSALSTTSVARRDGFNVALTFVLLAGMLALLASSPLISETLFAGLRLDDDFTARRIHAGIAYWLLIIVSVHLGLRWPLLMGVARRLLDLSGPNPARTVVLRAATIGIALQGMISASALDLRARLLFQMSLDWWNFEASVAGFFGHCTAVAGLCMTLTYYTMRLLRHATLRQPAATGTTHELRKGDP